MVDCSTQVIVAQHVTTDANDKRQLEPMLEECEETNGERPENVAADAGYWSEANAELQDKDDDLELYIATTKDWKRRKELAEQGPPRGRIPDDYGPKELMERKLRTKPGRRLYRKQPGDVIGEGVRWGSRRTFEGLKHGTVNPTMTHYGSSRRTFEGLKRRR